MKFCLKKLFVPFLLIVFIFTIGQVKDISAQLSGGGGSQASGLEGSVSGELRGKVGSGVFERLAKKPQGSAKKRTVRRKPAGTPNSSVRKPPIAKKPKRPRGKVPVEPDEDDDEYEDEDFSSLVYKPITNLNTAEKLANEFSTNAAERQLILGLFDVVKTAYDQEAAKKGKKNDVALALTFFVATCVTVHNESPEPSDPAFDNLYEALAESLVEDGNIANMSDRSKQEISESLVFISGLVLGGYMSGKQNNDQETVKIFRQLAGISLLSLTQIDPGRMSFNRNGLYIKP